MRSDVDFKKRQARAAINRDAHGIIRYSMAAATTPCRADYIARDSYWVTDPTRRNALIFLHSDQGYIPQHSVDEVVIAFMKQILFPWCEIKRLPAVFLVRHGKTGWQVPYGIQH